MMSARPIPSKLFSRNSVAATSRMRSRVSADFSRLTLIGPLQHKPPLTAYMMTNIYRDKIDVDHHLNPSRSRASKRSGQMRFRLFGQHRMLPNHAARVAGTVLVATLALTACKLDEKDVRLEPPLVRVTT